MLILLRWTRNYLIPLVPALNPLSNDVAKVPTFGRLMRGKLSDVKKAKERLLTTPPLPHMASQRTTRPPRGTIPIYCDYLFA